MERILTFDIGTTAIKTCIFDKALKLLAKRTDEYDLQGEGGRAELESRIYWETMCHAVKDLGKEHSLEQVAAICLTTQGETLIPVDEAGEALHPAVVWLDDRAGEQAKEILQQISREEIYRRTGVTDINGYVPLAKLLWFKQERPWLYRKTFKFLLLEDYLLFRLTGCYVTEKSLLTSTAYYDIQEDSYWETLLQDLGLDVGKLPEILECGSLVGTLQEAAAKELGLKTSVKVFAGAMDQIAAAIGGGGLQEGVVTATIGTAMVLTSLAAAGESTFAEPPILYRGFREKQYVILPQCSTAGAVFKWFKDQFCQWEVQQCKARGEDIYDCLCDAAKDVPAGARGVTLLPYFAGSLQPRCVAQAKGVFYGMSITTDKKALIRAVLESVGYMLRENLEMLRDAGIAVKQLHFFGGGAKNAIWNQILADIADVELVLLEQEECGSLGAAMLGAVSLGWYPDVTVAARCNGVRQTVKPDPEKKEIYEKAYERYQKLFTSLLPLFEEQETEEK